MTSCKWGPEVVVGDPASDASEEYEEERLDCEDRLALVDGLSSSEMHLFPQAGSSASAVEAPLSDHVRVSWSSGHAILTAGP